MRAPLRAFVVGLLLLGCGESHPPVMGTDAGPPPACDPPTIAVVIQSDYLPGTEVISLVLEHNDVVVDGTGLAEGDDLAGGISLGPLCEVRPNARIVARLLDGRGVDVAERLVRVDDPVDGTTITIVLSRGG